MAARWLEDCTRSPLNRATLLLVPSYGAGQQILHKSLLAQERPALNIHRLNLEATAQQLLRLAQPAPQLVRLNGLARIALLGQVVCQTKLRYFAKISRTLGFVNCLAKTLDELRLHGYGSSDLQPLGAAGEELALLLDGYEDALDREAVSDGARLLQLAASLLREGRVTFPWQRILLVDLPVVRPRELALLAALHEGTGELRAVVPTADLPTVRALASLLDDPHNLPSADHGPDLNLLHNTIFSASEGTTESDGGLDFFSAPTVESECLEIARRIYALCRQGMVVEDLAIAMRQRGPYVALLQESLARAGLRSYSAAGIARANPALRALLFLLRCRDEDYSASRFVEYLGVAREPERLSQGLGPWEKLIHDFSAALPLAEWQSRIAAFSRKCETDAQGRLDHLDHLTALVKFQRFVAQIEVILKALPQSGSWGEWLTVLGGLARACLAESESLLDWLKQLAPLRDMGPVDLGQVMALLESQSTEFVSDGEDGRQGCVYLASVEELRGQSFSVVFVVGLAERIFPLKVLQDPLLLDSQRSAVENGTTGDAAPRSRWQTICPLPQAHQRRDAERLGLHLALGAAKKSVVLSYPRSQAEMGQALVPSFYLLDAVKAVRGRLPSYEVLIEEAAAACGYKLIPDKAEYGIDEREFDLATVAEAVSAATGTNDGYAAHLAEHAFAVPALRAYWLRQSAKASLQHGFVYNRPGASQRDLSLDPGPPAPAAAPLSLQATCYSPHVLDLYLRCPYRFFLRGVLGVVGDAQTSATVGLSAREHSRLVHSVLAAAEEKIATGGDAWQLLKETFEQQASRCAESAARPVELLWQQEMRNTFFELAGWLRHRRKQWKAVAWAYRLNAEDLPDVEVLGFRLKGKIDLIEEDGEGRRRLTDYRTGELQQRWGIEQMLYALAYEAEHPGVRVEVLRRYYCTQAGRYCEESRPFDENLREKLGRVMQVVAEAMRQGEFLAYPLAGECNTCDYARLCRLTQLGQQRLPPVHPLNRARNLL